MDTPLFPEIVPETDANPVSFYVGEEIQFAKYGRTNEANLQLPLGIQKLKGFQFQGVSSLIR